MFNHFNTEYLDAWAEQKRQEAYTHLADVAPTEAMVQIIASASIAQCPYAQALLTAHGLDDSHVACITRNRMDIVDEYMREDERAYVNAY